MTTTGHLAVDQKAIKSLDLYHLLKKPQGFQANKIFNSVTSIVGAEASVKILIHGRNK
jgi:hypothetical protein